VPIVFTISSFEFHQVKLMWLHRRGSMAPNSSSDLNPLNYHVWGKWWSLMTSCNQRQKQFPSKKMHRSWFGLPYKQSTVSWKTSASDCKRVGQWWKFWIYNMIIPTADTDRYLVKCHMTQFVFLLPKICEFRNKLNWIVKIRGLTSKSDTVHIKKFR